MFEWIQLHPVWSAMIIIIALWLLRIMSHSSWLSLAKANEYAKTPLLITSHLFIDPNTEQYQLANDKLSVRYVVSTSEEGILKETLDFRAHHHSNGYVAFLSNGDIDRVRAVSGRLFPKGYHDDASLYEILNIVKNYIREQKQIAGSA